ncbi:hypothetical protein IJH26_01405 [Candidatus Saccharibacteria bacterium]|nr:hypothetical protein [Candidatus Saccharibacteria bacterium]MBQ7201957.1 hypothetical protein [Candidatus Saccharibacteria bacterium]
MDKDTEKDLRTELRVHARALGIPVGAAESFIDETIKSVKNALKKKTVITKADLERLVVKELKKYNSDFAYVYQNRDKII